MMKKLSAVVMLLLVASTASASVIVLKNGDRITGTVKKIWDDEVYIEPEYSDEFSVDQDAIAYIEDDRLMEIETAAGEDVLGALAGADEAGNQLVIVDGQTVAMPLAELEEMDEPEKYADWEILADVKTQFDRGNTKSEEVKFSGEAMYKLGKQKHILDWMYEYEKNDDIRTKDRDLYRYIFNYELVDPWFFGASAYYENDPIKNLDYRYNIIPALGYNIWDSAGATFNFQVGAGYQEQKTSGTDDLGNFFRESEGGGVASFLMRFRYDFGDPDLELYANNSTTKALYGNKNAVTQFVTGLRYEITDLLYANVEIDLDYETEPAIDADKEDFTILFGLGVEFDK
jgi:putative salt-induced outer membrane protein YdiY